MIHGLGGDNDFGLYVSRSRGYRRRYRVRLALKLLAGFGALTMLALCIVCGMLGYAREPFN